MFKIYGYSTVSEKVEQYQETPKKATALLLGEQFGEWGLVPTIIEWRKGWVQGRTHCLDQLLGHKKEGRIR